MTSEAFSLCGKFLMAMPSIGDQRFEKSLVFLCAHSSEGAMGFIVNKTLDSPPVPDFLTQLQVISEEEKKMLPSGVSLSSLYTGGPVEPGRGFVLHSPDFKSDSTLEVTDDVCLTATLEILRAIAKGRGPAKHLLALGYSGWSAGQLENEIAANGWLTTDGGNELIFDEADDRKYEKALKLLGIEQAALSSNAGHA